MTKELILAIDQGTTSSRAIIFDHHLKPLATAQKEFEQHFPQSGWVEHNPEDLWSTSIEMATKVIKDHGCDASDIAAIGITNQRETTLVWDSHTGEAVYPAIVWQDRRTSEYCQNLKNQGHEAMVTSKTGLFCW